MAEYDRRRERKIETPMGGVMIVEKLWNEGSEDEHWAWVQSLNPNLYDDMSNGDILGCFVNQYAVARQLVQEGYTFERQLDDARIIWTKPVDE